MPEAGLIVPDWRVPPNVHAFVTTRATGDMALAPGSLPSLPSLPATPCWLQQVHGVAVAELDQPVDDARVPVADAAWTSQPGVVCVVRTADCLPVLVAAATGEAVAAAHAGWRGLAAGVIEATVARLRARVAQGVQLRAWLGPAIGPGHFEVGAEVRAALLAADAGAGDAFAACDADRFMCDLYALARRRLAALGITDVAGGGLCTYADEARFYSHRRDVQHRGLDATGRMASFIWRT